MVDQNLLTKMRIPVNATQEEQMEALGGNIIIYESAVKAAIVPKSLDVILARVGCSVEKNWVSRSQMRAR